MTKLTKAQALAVRELIKIQEVLISGDWALVRTASLQLAALADNREQREAKK
jgi:hypothetical protein